MTCERDYVKRLSCESQKFSKPPISVSSCMIINDCFLRILFENIKKSHVRENLHLRAGFMTGSLTNLTHIKAFFPLIFCP